jgi:Domain of unknown function (DUF4190)
MIPLFPVQRVQNNLVKTSLILCLGSVLAATLFHFFLYFYNGVLDNTIFIVFVSTPFVFGIVGIITGMISLGEIMTNNMYGKGKAITGIVLGGVIVVCLIYFLFYLFSNIWIL